MESRAAVETMEAIGVSTSALAVFVDLAAGNGPFKGDQASGGADPLRDQADARRDGAGLDPLRDQADAYLDGLAELAKVEARLAALKVQIVAGYANTEKAMTPPAASPQERTVREMAVTAEAACALTISERAAGALLFEARTLTTGLPVTLSALQAGSISWQDARIMVDETVNLDALRTGGCSTPRTGTGWPGFRLTCPQPRLPGSGTAPPPPPGQCRGTLTQLRADIASTWLLSAGLELTPASIPAGHERTPAGSTNGVSQGASEGAGGGRAAGGGDSGPSGGAVDDGFAGLGSAGNVPSPVAQVLITVPALSLLGLTQEPAMLDGYGPIPPSMARALVADGAPSFRRVLTDPRDGAPSEVGRTSYRIPKPLRQWLRLRDAKCTFPGCNNHSLDNDADHLLAWARGGTTGISNLGQPCPKHHRLKRNSAWTPAAATANDPPGWTSHTGRHYASEQPDWEPPHWPPLIQAILNGFDPGPSVNSASQGAVPGTGREAA